MKKLVIEYEQESEILEKLQVMISERRITGPSVVNDRLSFIKNKKQEHFVTVMLDGAHNIIEASVVTIGIANKTMVHPREIFRPAIEMNCSAIILAHNHPSGMLEPSPEDINITHRMKEAGEILGIEVLDHVIVGRSGYLSMVESGDF